ncbi:MAG: hypothetical protein SFU98_09985 [Leptospiraceae bacterium]|nr:hypothetical protein [Leptospiraceae bacterium]
MNLWKVTPKINLLTFIILICLLSAGCNQLGEEKKNFWSKYFSYQEQTRNKFFFTEYWDIFLGTLKPEEVNLLKKEPNGDMKLYFHSDSTSAKVSKDELKEKGGYLVSVLFRESKFSERPTFFYHREMKISNIEIYTINDFWKWLRTTLSSDSTDSIIKSSKAYSFFSDLYEIQTSEDEKSYTFKFKPKEKLKQFDEFHYNRMMRILNVMILDIKLLTSDDTIFARISNDHNMFKIIALKDKFNNPEEKATLKFDLDLFINFYGLKIDLKGIQYKIDYSENSKNAIMKGYYSKKPSVKISGGLLYILPPFLLNLFIPDDMETYFNQFFDLAINGNKGKGSFFETKISKVGNKMNILSVNEGEIFQKTFRFLLTPSPKDRKQAKFINELEKKLLLDFD